MCVIYNTILSVQCVKMLPVLSKTLNTYFEKINKTLKSTWKHSIQYHTVTDLM